MFFFLRNKKLIMTYLSKVVKKKLFSMGWCGLEKELLVIQANHAKVITEIS